MDRDLYGDTPDPRRAGLCDGLYTETEIAFPNFPIIDLHCHLEGSIDPQRSYEILHRAGHPLAREREPFFKHVTGFEPGWDGFNAAVHLLDRCMMDRATVIEVVADVVARAAEQHVKILEPTFAPAEFKCQENVSGDLRPFTEAVIAGVEKGAHSRDIAVGLRMLIRPRHLTDAFTETYGDVRKHVAEYRQHIVGVDVCTLDRLGPERHDPRRLRELCEFVKAALAEYQRDGYAISTDRQSSGKTNTGLPLPPLDTLYGKRYGCPWTLSVVYSMCILQPTAGTSVYGDGLGLALVPLPDDPVDASPKAKYPLAYADAFAAALAIQKGAVLVTGDQQFKTLEDVLNIHWLPETE